MKGARSRSVAQHAAVKADEPAGPQPATHDAEESGPGHNWGKGLRQHLLDDARREAAAGANAGAHAAVELGHAAEATALATVATGLQSERALVGHVVGMHVNIPASHLHGPRETPVFLYLFTDALAVRPTDDAPMSTVPIVGLHMVLPEVAIARWLYKAGRIEHANLDLVKDSQRFADSLAHWTVDDFADADEKVEVHRANDVTGPIHVYEHLGFANLWLPTNGKPVRLRTAMPASSEAFVGLWRLISLVEWPNGLRTDVPADTPDGAHRGGPDGSPGSALSTKNQTSA